ncbi:MAG: thioredoxin [Candidatus Altiarchaeota archaeon]|nr:thioredoxin [Candidatus Altiarchaeota archaeon]
MASVVELKDDTFRDFVSKGYAVVDLWTPCCGPCRMITPIVEELSVEYKGKIRFGKLNIDENLKTPSEFKVMRIPTLLMFKDGVLVDRIVGALSKERIKEKLDKRI